MPNISSTIPPPVDSVSETHAGGAKKRRPSKSKVASKPSQSKASSSKASSSKTSSKSKASASSRQTSKKGGALVDDIKNLAVPFAILLAKQGLSSIFEKDSAKKPTRSQSARKAPAAKPASIKRRKSITGGSACTSGCGMTGGAGKSSKKGAVQTQFDSIAREIENFLQKY